MEETAGGGWEGGGSAPGNSVWKKGMSGGEGVRHSPSVRNGVVEDWRCTRSCDVGQDH